MNLTLSYLYALKIVKLYVISMLNWVSISIGNPPLGMGRAEPSQKALLKKQARAEPKYTFENISSSQVEPEKYWLEPSQRIF